MKNIILLITAMMIISNSFAGDEKIVPSKISKVTVYSQGAQIYRKASYSIGKGVTEIVIDGVSNNIDGNSLQVNATGNSIILDTKYSLFYPENKVVATGLPLKIRKKIALLEDSISVVNYTIRELQDEIDVYKATKSILANNGAIRGKGKVNDSIGLLKHAIEYYTVKMMEVNKKLNKLNRSKGKSQKKQQGMNQRLIDLRNFQNNGDNKHKQVGPSYRITVTFKSDAAVSGKLDVSYLVSNAGWTPMYDLRSDATSSKINLNYKANVHQNTGVDWKDVRLNISTNNPYHNKTKPTLHPWYVDYNIYRDQSLKKFKDNRSRGNIPRKAAEMDYAESESLDDIQISTNSAAPGAATYAADASSFVTVVDNLISAEFRIDLPYSIKSNNQKHMVLVKNVDIDANYKYYTVPKYDKSVYLVAQLSKLDELQLVPAKANIFFDGTYMGETYINPSSMEDTLSLSLGKDPNIIVNRTLMKKECKEKVVGAKKERTFAYSIEVKNLKSRTIKLVVQDQVPITTNADIEIEATDLSKGKLNKKTGLVEWEFNLKPKQKKEISLSYKVKHDKDKNLVVN